MPLCRCAVLHELVVPDASSVCFPARLVSYAPAKRTTRDRAISLRQATAARLHGRRDVNLNSKWRAEQRRGGEQRRGIGRALSPLKLPLNQHHSHARAAQRRLLGLPVSWNASRKSAAARTTAAARPPADDGRNEAMARRERSSLSRPEMRMPKPPQLHLPAPARRMLPLKTRVEASEAGEKAGERAGDKAGEKAREKAAKRASSGADDLARHFGKLLGAAPPAKPRASKEGMRVLGLAFSRASHARLPSRLPTIRPPQLC